jgi:hypothetical protein
LRSWYKRWTRRERSSRGRGLENRKAKIENRRELRRFLLRRG